jgi:hypothetical protein
MSLVGQTGKAQNEHKISGLPPERGHFIVHEDHCVSYRDRRSGSACVITLHARFTRKVECKMASSD